MRYFVQINPAEHASVSAAFAVLAVASMFVGNLLALLNAPQYNALPNFKNGACTG